MQYDIYISSSDIIDLSQNYKNGIMPDICYICDPDRTRFWQLGAILNLEIMQFSDIVQSMFWGPSVWIVLSCYKVIFWVSLFGMFGVSLF